MRKIEHLGIAVKDLKKSNELFSRLFGREAYKEEKVEGEAVVTSFFQMGEVKVELLEATSDDSAIAKFIDKRSEGIHHVAFAVDDIHAEMERLQEEGFELLNDVPKKGADHKLVVFLHPRSTNGVLVELCQVVSNTEKP
ncbi:methylmalonyl-CoA epimerase [Echinicola strongylocentroti]|uniref:Methylmalonyl-CoA epimerase n=1 Tax=Echinicola strongylocentroti TaxID=1795355 RepID=A0A2Z4IH38_9BACT|nr:methylmalonyl-CoA epimerase [Echinicola strongylocentroti]AWW29886.1 methylmalonyl-CoA epimerase [Echinicola strongylocentroti]